MRYYIVIILVIILSQSIALGQYNSSIERPEWVEGYFIERANSYIEVVSAVGYSEDNARDKAVRIIVGRRSLATGQHAQISIKNGNINVNGSDALTVKSRIIDQYTERLGAGEYRVSLLVQTAKHPEFPYEPVAVTDKYKFSSRVFVPGMAQIHKGHTTRGILFIAGEIAAVGGIVTFEGLRSSYEAKIKRTHNANDIQRYINMSDNMCNIRNGFIAGAAAIYAWNIIDGIVAKGKKHVVIGSAQIAFVPYSSATSQGMQVCVTF